MPAIALADRNGVYGAARFHTAAQPCGVKAHIGAEIAVSRFGKRAAPPDWLPHGWSHVWLGTTVENMTEARRHLEAFEFLISCELEMRKLVPRENHT